MGGDCMGIVGNNAVVNVRSSFKVGYLNRPHLGSIQVVNHFFGYLCLAEVTRRTQNVHLSALDCC